MESPKNMTSHLPRNSRFVAPICLFALFVLIPCSAMAQAVIAGIVRDASGAVLPGVTVEASSPALIEKVRIAVTDGTGQYRVEDLRPGTYAVTFSLTGFSTLKREGVELAGSFTATINADLKVGAVAETITVTGETPIVDVQSAKRQMTLTNELVRSIPNTRNYNSMVVLVPGVTTNINDASAGIVTTQFPIHGGRNNEGRLSIDGLNVVNPPGGGQPIQRARQRAPIPQRGFGEPGAQRVEPGMGGGNAHRGLWRQRIVPDEWAQGD